MNVSLLSQHSDLPDDLDEVASRSRSGTFYHTSVWLESLAEAYPSLAFRCLVAEESGETVGFLPFFVGMKGPVRTVWSLPFGTYGGPAAVSREAHDGLLGAYRGQMAGKTTIEVGLVDFHNEQELRGSTMEPCETHIVDISRGFDALWSEQFERQRRRRTRRARESGVVIRRASSIDEARSFFRVYEERLGEWGARGGHPEALFLGLFARGGETVRLYLAVHEGDVVGGHLNFYYKESVTAWYGMTSRRGVELQAGTLLYTDCMRAACEDGYQNYNLGGSLGKRSLVEYKESLGGVPHRYRLLRARSLLGRAAGRFRRSAGRG